MWWDRILEQGPDLEAEKRDREEWVRQLKQRYGLVTIDDVTAYCAPGMSVAAAIALDLAKARYGKIEESSVLRGDEIFLARDMPFSPTFKMEFSFAPSYSVSLRLPHRTLTDIFTLTNLI